MVVGGAGEARGMGDGGWGGGKVTCAQFFKHSLGPRPSRDSLTKDGRYLTLVVLSQHVRKTGNPIRSLDLKGSAARHAHARTGRPDIDDANWYKIS